MKGVKRKIKTGLVIFNMLALVSVVYFIERKNKITASVLRIARQITSFVFTGLKVTLVFSMVKPAIKKPSINLKNETSIAGIFVPEDANFTKTVALAKHNSDIARSIIPLYKADFMIDKNRFYFISILPVSKNCPEKNGLLSLLKPLNIKNEKKYRKSLFVVIRRPGFICLPVVGVGSIRNSRSC